jgi:type VI secretion system protein ImpL
MKQTIKQLSNLINPSLFVPIFILSALSVLIWYVGPLISIADSTPLESSEKRLYMILVLFLGWVLKVNFFEGASAAKPVAAPAAVTNPEFTKKVQTLEARFQGAIRFLKKTMLNKSGKSNSLYHLPWYLLMGPANSGKTTLLANAGINFILSKQFKNESLKNIPPSDVCDWWVTRDVVLLDVPINYLYSRQKNLTGAANNQPKATPYVMWQSFLTLVKKYRGKQALSGVMLALPLPELMTQQNRERSFAELKQRITELREQFGTQLPFYLSITKCDLLPGFLDFFSDSGSDELAQAWGITISALKENETVIEAFTNRFNALIKRLNKQLIWRLHQERNAYTRPQIKDFPLQIERLKENIVNVLKLIAGGDTQFHLQGVYLTSSVQQNVEEQVTHLHSVGSMPAQGLQIMRNPAMPSRAYFIRQLFLQGILATGEALPPSKNIFNWRKHPIVYSIGAGTAVIALAFLANELRYSVTQTYAIKNSLAQYQVEIQQASMKAPHLAKALPLLNALQQTADGHTVLPYTDRAQQSANTAYQEALKTIVLPEIKNDLETYLTTATNKNPENLYIALKAYLMLGEGKHLQPDFVFDALQRISPSLFNKQNNSELSSHIHAALNTAWQPIDCDEDLISRARQELISMTPATLGFAILKSSVANNLENTISLEINTDTQTALINKEISYQIPKMFTAETFNEIYDHQIAAAVREINGNGWVLPDPVSTQSTDALVDQLRAMYVSNYVSAWENVLNNVQLLVPTTLAEVDSQVVSLAHDNSPLLQLLSAVRDNTAFAPITNASPKLAAISVLLINSANPNSELGKTFTALNNVHTGLQTVLHASDPKAAAFKIAEGHLKNPNNTKDFITVLFTTAESSPAPLKNWLNGIAAKSWHFVLQDTAQHIEKHWQNDIMTVYNEQLANRYPFAPNASQEVSLEQFTRFLGTHGTITGFYENYLQAFIDITGRSWSWKRMNGDQLPFTDLVLNGLQRAAQLQHTFFPNDDDQLAIKFTMQPAGIEHNTKKVQLTLNGQSIQFDHETPAVPQALAWPGNKNVRMAALHLYGSNNKIINNNITGEWGWFKLISKSTQKVISQKELLLSFEGNGHKARYLLVTQGYLNPFLPLNLQNFHLPQELGDNFA